MASNRVTAKADNSWLPGPAAWRRSLLWGIIGTAFLVTVLAPASLIPIYGDDFNWPLLWYRAFEGDPWIAIATAWHSDLQPNRFNPIGREFALTYHFFAVEVSMSLGIDMHWYYALGTFALIWLTVLTAAWAFVSAARFVSDANRVSVWVVFALLAGIFAVTVQLHPSFHDPTLTISEIGYGNAILSFLLIGVAFWACRPTTTPVRAGLVVGVLTTVGVLFYESFVAAVAATALLYVWLLIRTRRIRNARRKPIVLLLAGVLLPALLFLAGRLYVSTVPGVPEYGGTELVLGLGGVKVLGYLLLGTLPASGWRNAWSQLGGVDVSLAAAVNTSIIVVLLIVVVLLLRKTRTRRLERTERSWIAIAVFAAVFLLVPASISFTAKYAEEIDRLGAVYISYGMLILLVAMAVLLLMVSLPRPNLPVAIVGIALVAVFTFAQQTVTWSVAHHFESAYAPNRTITSAIVSTVSTDEDRCRTLYDWYEVWGYVDKHEELRGAISWAYEHKFGIPFCDRTGGAP